MNERFRKESESDFAFMSVFGVVTCVGRVRRKWCLRHAMTTSVSRRGASVWYRTSDDARRSLPIVYLIYLAFQVDPEEVGAGGIY